MYFGMDEKQFETFIERMAATTIANDAVLKCQLCGIEPTAENITLFVGDFLDPSQPQAGSLVLAISKAIDDLATLGERGKKLDS